MYAGILRNEETKLVATGVPLHIVVADDVKELSHKITSPATNLSKARHIMKIIIQKIREACPHCTEAHLFYTLPLPELDALFNAAYQSLLVIVLYPGPSDAERDKRKVGDLSYVTLYELIVKCL